MQLAEYAAQTSTGSAGQMSDDVSGVSAHCVFLLAALHDAFTLLGSLLPEGHHAKENAIAAIAAEALTMRQRWTETRGRSEHARHGSYVRPCHRTAIIWGGPEGAIFAAIRILVAEVGAACRGRIGVDAVTRAVCKSAAIGLTGPRRLLALRLVQCGRGPAVRTKT